MVAKSSLTWRTLGLSLVGLCLACAHGAQAGPTPRMRTASGAGAAPLPLPPISPARGGRPGGWRGVGATTIAADVQGGQSRDMTVRPDPDAPEEIRITAPAPEALASATTQRQRAADQMLRIEAQRNMRPVVATDPVAQARPAIPAAPERRRDPRVTAALRPLASAPMLTRDVFGATWASTSR